MNMANTYEVHTHWTQLPVATISFFEKDRRVHYTIKNAKGDLLCTETIAKESRCSDPAALKNRDINGLYAQVVVHCQFKDQFGLMEKKKWWAKRIKE